MRVLLIEDDSPTSKIVESVLKNEGISVDTSDLGVDGLEIGKIYDYDAIILDLLLPDIDGFEVIRRLRAADIATPVIILSGLSESKDKVKCLEIGADDFVTKPFERKELVARVQAVVRRSKGHSESVIKIGRLTINLRLRVS